MRQALAMESQGSQEQPLVRGAAPMAGSVAAHHFVLDEADPVHEEPFRPGRLSHLGNGSAKPAPLGQPNGMLALSVEQPRSKLSSRSPRSPERRKARASEAPTEVDKDIASFEGFYAPWWKTALYYIGAILTGGLLLLAAKWSPKAYIALCLARCELNNATYVRITLLDGRVDLETVSVITVASSTGGSHPSPTMEDEDGQGGLLNWQDAQQHRLLEYRCARYFYVESMNTFSPVSGSPKGFNVQLQKAAYKIAATGQAANLEDSDWDVFERQMRYGPNEMVIPVKSMFTLIFDEMWHPFYVFQYCSIVIWVAGDQYYSYSICIMVITWFSIISSAWETYQNMKRLANIAYFHCDVELLRGGELHKVDSPVLVPGDIVVVGHGPLPADLVLLRGECIVDENMLTGESVPVRKVCYSPVADGLGYDPDKHSQCTLFCGTMVAQAKSVRGQRPIGMVVRTRFYSAKGQLLRSILFPREHQENFVSDSMKFIAFMLTGCIGLFIWAAVELHRVGAPPLRIFIRFLDMITIAVPPALPACLTIGSVFAIGRLRKKGIYVTSPDRVTVAGQLDVVCFDKTGTLTVQGLDLQGIQPIVEGNMGMLVKAPKDLPFTLQQLLASCHGLARMGADLVGDPLDQKLFLATGWELVEERDTDAPVMSQHVGVDDTAEADAAAAVHSFVRPIGAARSHAIIRRFEFNAALQRNVVVTRTPAGPATGGTFVFAKGSPEMIRTLVQPHTVPKDFDAVLGEYTRRGLRVLALASGDVSQIPEAEIMSWTQQQTEAAVPLRLVGLAVMANPLRPDSADVISKLQEAAIRTVMVTGDHVRTAISVAHQCNIMPTQRAIALVDGSDDGSGEGSGGQFVLSILNVDGTVSPGGAPTTLGGLIMAGEMECAVTGKGFNRLVATQEASLLPAVLHRSCVFARMSPDNKRDLMQLLGSGLDGVDSCPHLKLHVGFCGDGANDCGALKAAHVGVSLCEAEASVAAPMTSKNQTIASMLVVVAEGRCTLMATYQIFQFIIGYALIQAFETNIMYTYALAVGNYQYLIEDLFFTTVLAALMSFTEPRVKLSRQKPLSRVMSAPLLISTAMQLVVVVLFQLISLWALAAEPGYKPFDGAVNNPNFDEAKAPENTVTYIIVLAQFIILALVFNKGRPHRAPLWTNPSLMVAIMLQIMFVIYTLFAMSPFNSKVQELVDNRGVVSRSFRGKLFGIIVANAGVAYLFEFMAIGIVRLIRCIWPDAKLG